MVIFSQDCIIKTNHQALLAAGFRCLNTGTLYEFYTKEGESSVYKNTQTGVFFKNPEFKEQVMEKLKIIVAGGRDFKNYNLLKETMERLLRNRKPEEVEIVWGGANGADSLGKKYADEKGMDSKLFQADWESYGLSAGPRRNKEMAEYGTHCICFWDGRSKGTRNMIELAKKFNLKLRIVSY